MSPGPVESFYQGRDRRERRAAVGLPASWPLLSLPQRELLTRWARADGLTRQREVLLRQAGPSQLEMAEQLIDLLMQHGWLSVKERRVQGAWQLQAITWLDLAGLKTALGLDSRQDRQARREELLTALAGWVLDQPDLAPAVQALKDQQGLPVDRLAERIALLSSLADWQAEQRTGTRRDFALAARDDTKSLSDAEWAWLETSLDLPAMGIERFVPQLWLAGDLSLAWGHRCCDLQALHCVGLSAADLLTLTGAAAPVCYWLIENRASFERQAMQRDAGVALIWLPGRPPSTWLRAVGCLLDHAPASALVSADPDPAGVEIALTAGALWQARSLPWKPHEMGVHALAAALRTRALDEHHDRPLLARLKARTDMPHELTALCEYMSTHGVKAEQEGWL